MEWNTTTYIMMNSRLNIINFLKKEIQFFFSTFLSSPSLISNKTALKHQGAKLKAVKMEQWHIPFHFGSSSLYLSPFLPLLYTLTKRHWAVSSLSHYVTLNSD